MLILFLTIFDFKLVLFENQIIHFVCSIEQLLVTQNVSKAATYFFM